MLREALMKALTDPEFKAEAQKRNWEVEPVTGRNWKRSEKGDGPAAGRRRTNEKNFGAVRKKNLTTNRDTE